MFFYQENTSSRGTPFVNTMIIECYTYAVFWWILIFKSLQSKYFYFNLNLCSVFWQKNCVSEFIAADHTSIGSHMVSLSLINAWHFLAYKVIEMRASM